MKIEVGYRIRKLRESKDFSQENMAGELGMSKSAYSKIETGKTDPSVGRLVAIAKVLEVDVTYLFPSVGAGSIARDNAEPAEFATKNDIRDISQQIGIIRQEILELKKKRNAKTAKPVKR